MVGCYVQLQRAKMSNYRSLENIIKEVVATDNIAKKTERDKKISEVKNKADQQSADTSDKLKEDYEYGMARNELATAKRAIDRLNTIMGKGEGNLEAWVQSKITKASDYLDTVADYLESGAVKEETDPGFAEEIEQIDEISDKLAWSYTNANLKEPTPDVTTDAGFKKSQNRNAGLKLALNKQSYPKTSLNKAKVPTSDAADKEKKYQDAIKEDESEGTKYRTSLEAANVGRPLSNKSKLAKQGEILKKKIDEEKAMAGNIKRIIFGKKKANSKETEVEFNPKLKKGLDEEITDDEIRQNAANTRQRAAALKAQQISNARATADMEAKFQKGEISKDDLEKHYKGAQGQVASLAPGVKVANKAEKTSDDQVVGMTRGAETIANYSPVVTHQIAQGALKAAGGDYAGAAGHIAGAAAGPIASKVGSAASGLVNAGKGWLSKIAGGSTNLATQAAVPAAAVAIPAAAKAEEQPKPQEAQAKVETPKVEVGSPPKQETPDPVVKPAEAPKPSGMNPPAPIPPKTPPKPPVQVAKGEGKVGTALAGLGVSKNDRRDQSFVDKTLGAGKFKAGSAEANMALQKQLQAPKPAEAPKPEAEAPKPPEPPKPEVKPPEAPKAPESPPEGTSFAGEDGGKTKKKKVNESALIRSFISKYQK